RGRGPGGHLVGRPSRGPRCGTRGSRRMKLVLFERDGRVAPGVLVDAGVVDVTSVAPPAGSPQATMESIIDRFDDLRVGLDSVVERGTPIPMESVRLHAPLPRPSKIMCCIANYWEHAQREARPLNMFIKNPDAVIGPGDTVRLPDFTVP